MNILIYTHDFAPSIGGVQTITTILAQGLADANSPANGRPAQANDVTVVTRTPAGTMDDEHLAYRVVRFPSTAHLYQLIRRADILHISGPAILPMAMGLLLRKPVVVEHHGYQAICPSGVYLHQPDGALCPGYFESGDYRKCFHCQAAELSNSRSLRNLLLMFPRRWLAKRVTANIGPSNYTGRRIALPRTHTIYHGIEDPLAPAPVHQVSRKPLCFAYLGRLVPEKGVDLLLHAAGKLKQSGHAFRLKVIGDGPERKALEHIAEELHLGDWIEFLGYRQAGDLRDLLADVSVSVIPSRWEEAAGLAAIEPMMRGGLVIAADIGGLGEMVGNVGLKFPPDDTDALADCMRRVIENPDLINSVGEVARQRATKVFRKENMTEQHLHLYGRLVHETGAARE
jgi:glycogen(starch) synthase